MAEATVLSAQRKIEIRFNEVDMMGVVWHGTYPAYLEDAREAFGAKYGLSYTRYIVENIFAPIVDMQIKYRRPLRYGMEPLVKIRYVNSQAAKIIFDYEIVDPSDNAVCLTARTVQVFMDRDYNLLWNAPEFYVKWKKSVGLI